MLATCNRDGGVRHRGHRRPGAAQRTVRARRGRRRQPPVPARLRPRRRAGGPASVPRRGGPRVDRARRHPRGGTGSRSAPGGAPARRHGADPRPPVRSRVACLQAGPRADDGVDGRDDDRRGGRGGRRSSGRSARESSRAGGGRRRGCDGRRTGRGLARMPADRRGKPLGRACRRSGAPRRRSRGRARRTRRRDCRCRGDLLRHREPRIRPHRSPRRIVLSLREAAARLRPRAPAGRRPGVPRAARRARSRPRRSHAGGAGERVDPAPGPRSCGRDRPPRGRALGGMAPRSCSSAGDHGAARGRRGDAPARPATPRGGPRSARAGATRLVETITAQLVAQLLHAPTLELRRGDAAVAGHRQLHGDHGALAARTAQPERSAERLDPVA